MRELAEGRTSPVIHSPRMSRPGLPKLILSCNSAAISRHVGIGTHELSQSSLNQQVDASIPCVRNYRQPQ